MRAAPGPQFVSPSAVGILLAVPIVERLRLVIESRERGLLWSHSWSSARYNAKLAAVWVLKNVRVQRRAQSDVTKSLIARVQKLVCEL